MLGFPKMSPNSRLMLMLKGFLNFHNCHVSTQQFRVLNKNVYFVEQVNKRCARVNLTAYKPSDCLPRLFTYRLIIIHAATLCIVSL